MKTSLALAVYNGIYYLEQQLDSLRNQSKSIDQVVIVDDCSTDGSFEFIKKYLWEHKLNNWELYKNDSNHGYKYTFHKAVSLTCGEVVFLCDQDDIWRLNKVELIIEIMEKYDSVFSLCTACSFIDNIGFPIERQKGLLGNETGIIRFFIRRNKLKKVKFNEVFVRNVAQGCTMCIRRKLIDDFIDIYNCEMPHDWFINMLASIKYDGLYYLNKELIEYRLHGNNTIGLSESGHVKADTNKNHKLSLFSIEKVFLSLCMKHQVISKMKYDKFIKTIENREKFYAKKSLNLFFKSVGRLYNYKKIYNWRQIIVDLKYLLS